MIAVLIPSRTDALLLRCLDSLRRSDPDSLAATYVIDNGLKRQAFLAEHFPTVHWAGYPATLAFSFALAINLGAQETPPDADLFLLNDDAVMVTPDWRARCQTVLDREDARGFGVVSALIKAGTVGNPEQKRDDGQPVRAIPNTAAFIAVLIRRACWDALDGLDAETFGPGSYGFEDADFTHRARLAGWEVGVGGAVAVHHLGDPAVGMHGTYLPLFGDRMGAMFAEGQRRFRQKWPGLAG